MDLYHACEIAEGFGEPVKDEAELQEAWQFIWDTGAWRTLQGFYGRMCHRMLEDGFIVNKENV